MKASIDSPFGPLCLAFESENIVALEWHDVDDEGTAPLVEEARAQMAAYFRGDLTTFDLPLAPRGDAFQQSVCEAMLAIPYGETRTYGDIARDLGTFGQPVGQACGGNSIPIIIPCHRVLATGVWGGIPARAVSSSRSRC